MKKMITLMAMILFSSIALAQIKVETNGDIEIGSTTSAIVKMLMSGNNFIDAPDPSGNLVFRTGGTNSRFIIYDTGNIDFLGQKLVFKYGAKDWQLYSVADNFYIRNETDAVNLIRLSSDELDVKGEIVSRGLTLAADDIDYKGVSGAAYIYSSSALGSSYPFNETGNLILQSRRFDTRDMLFVTGANATPRMVIKGTGHVGIGTIAPEGKLHINGDVIIGDDDYGFQTKLYFRQNDNASYG